MAGKTLGAVVVTGQGARSKGGFPAFVMWRDETATACGTQRDVILRNVCIPLPFESLVSPFIFLIKLKGFDC